MPCCEDYAATVDQSPEAGATQSDIVSARAFAASQALPVCAAPGEPTSGARYIPGSYVLLGLLVSCVSVLGVALTIQMRNAAESARELAATRRLSEEMIALMKEARREAAKPAVAPQTPAVEAERNTELSSGEVAVAAPPVEAAKSPAAIAELRSETTSDVPTGEAGAPPQAAPAVAPPPVAPAASSTVANADTASNSVAPASVAILGAETSLAPTPHAASAAPAPESTAEQVGVARLEAAKPLKKAPRTVEAVKEKIETRRPSAAAKAREKAAELDREPASVDWVNQRAEPKSSSAESAKAFRELASLPPAVRSTALPARTTIVSPWTKLERGMSRKKVRSLLGKPRSTDRLKTAEFWFYAERSMFARSWVAFSERGGVIEWLTP